MFLLCASFPSASGNTYLLFCFIAGQCLQNLSSHKETDVWIIMNSELVRLFRPIRFWDIDTPTFSKQLAHRWQCSCQSYAPAPLYRHREDSRRVNYFLIVKRYLSYHIHVRSTRNILERDTVFLLWNEWNYYITASRYFDLMYRNWKILLLWMGSIMLFY